jgi:YARHG domain
LELQFAFPSIWLTDSIETVLTAAKRWANRQIDDFTLQIDTGEYQDICIGNNFFGNVSEWKTDSAVKCLQSSSSGGEGGNIDTCEFFIRKGMIVFTKKDFKPAGELHFRSFNNYYFRSRAEDEGDDEDTDKPSVFDWKKSHLPFSIDNQDAIPPPADEFSKKVLRNLPFARRGYVFKSPELQAYFERQKWYWPDSGYIPATDSLSRKEQEWLKK